MMAGSDTDIRGLLHYVPQFRGKTFVIDLDWLQLNDSARAEVVMDMSALQSVGVRLLLVVGGEEALDDFFEWGVDQEFRLARVNLTDPVTVASVLARGQAGIASREGSALLGSDVTACALALKASKLIVMASHSVSMNLHSQPLRYLRASEVAILTSAVKGEGAWMLNGAATVCEAGVPRVHLLDASQPGVLISELFSNEGVGVMVYADSYRVIRALREEDISELLGMIGRTVRNANLVPRSYEEIVSSLSDYVVMEVDENVVGCAALYRYEEENSGEVACLYVKQNHGGMGYGEDLVKHMEERARNAGFEKVFALTNRAADFFQQKLGYHPLDWEELPKRRQQALRMSGRESQAFVKSLLSSGS